MAPSQPEEHAEQAPVFTVLKAAQTGLGTQAQVAVVVPCFNEESALDNLADVLTSVMDTARQFHWEFIFVDDGSSDGTPAVLSRVFGAWPNCAVLRHQRNQGISASILTGIRYAQTEVVCSIDCDCTYDPHELAKMVPLLTEEVELVTASPYHPEGRVDGVPAWRLVLSKAASLLYRWLLRQQLYTYTSCFRVYRRAAVLRLPPTQPTYSGIAELLLLLLREGAGVVEYPTTLRMRQFGHSKMKILRTIRTHLGLLARFAVVRWLPLRKRPRTLPLARPTSPAAPDGGLSKSA